VTAQLDPGRAAELRHVMKVADRPPLAIAGGHGSWLWDRDGRRYLDFVQGWAVNCLGHSPKAIVNALADQAARLVNCSPAYYNEPMVRLATMIGERFGPSEVFFCNSGAEANEGAIKLARKWGARHRNGAYEIVTMEHAFHGRTLAMMSASDKPGWAAMFEPKVAGFPKVPLNDLDAVRAAVTDRTVAVMLEPIQGEAGVFVATDDYLRALRRFTEERGLLLILDEVQTGVGRTGRFFGYEHAGIRPDIMTLGKGLGGGVPLAALVASERASIFEHGDQGGTFNGSPLMTAVGCAVVEAVGQPQFLDGVAEQGRYLAERLGAVSARFGHGEVRGRGLLLALRLAHGDSRKVVEAARDRGLLINAPRPDSLRFMPALDVSRDEIDEMLRLLEVSLTAAP
jgi:acetylornithine/N-succinyldiaminopimelate aminotransferase